MTGRQQVATGEKETAGISRRRLLKLAAYSVPAMSLMSVAASRRALAMSPGEGCVFPVRVRLAAPGEEGLKAVQCGTGQEFLQFDPDRCAKYVATGIVGQGFVFSNCSTGVLWYPDPNVCYTFRSCPDPDTSECYQAWRNCP